MDMHSILHNGIQTIRQSIVYCRLRLWEDIIRPPCGCSQGALQLNRITRDHLDGRFGSYRDDAILKQRLDAGFLGYWFAYEGAFVHAHWYARHVYDVWDVRCRLHIPSGSFYLFDVYTVARYRGNRFFQEALAKSAADLDRSEKSRIYALTQAHNMSISAAFKRTGFQHSNTITFFQIPPLRYYGLRSRDVQQRSLRLMRWENPPPILDLEQGRLVDKEPEGEARG